MSFLDVRDISKAFGDTVVLDRVSFSLEQGSIFCILGPSGSGKTTLLRIIAGLEMPDEGAVLFKGRDLRRIQPHLRRFGMMFQEFALFPHMDVWGNIAFGLHMRKFSRGDIVRRTGEMLSLVGLEGFGKRSVGELSGGERQRVALARSLAPYPVLLLLDEPLGSLDRALREKLLLDLREILRRIGMTTIFVTHDQAEAFAVSDTIAVMDRGGILQLDTPENLYRRPASPHIARFLGLANIIEGRVETASSVSTSLGALKIATHGYARGETVSVLIRPDAARISAGPESVLPEASIIEGIVQDSLFKGKSYHVEIEAAGSQTLVFDFPLDMKAPAVGSPVRLELLPWALTIMPGKASQSIK
jgi:ABC-type Fe3+/spermidine/putrescine transport system ATPase subunit